MPIYEYKCPECSHIFDELKWRNNETICPECGELAERSEVMPRVGFNYFTLKQKREAGK